MAKKYKKTTGENDALNYFIKVIDFSPFLRSKKELILEFVKRINQENL
ncbi:hypothetical protein [Mycoplasmopsis lipofaciens]|nr:hypothetical protein [Mycoplasmopsis lipofaciens]